MSDKDQIKELFSKKLGNYEAKVNPEMWTNIASQVGVASTTTAAAGTSLLVKAIIGISGAAVLTTGMLLYNYSDEEKAPEKDTSEMSAVANDSKVNESEESPNFESKTVVEPNESQGSKLYTPTQDAETSAVITQDALVVAKAEEKMPEIATIDTIARAIPPKGAPEDAVAEKNKEDVKQARDKDIEALVNAPDLSAQDEPVNSLLPSIQEEQPTLKEEVTFEIPNVLTLNGDGINDTYQIKCSVDNFESFEFVIYDRMGNVVMIAKDCKFKWTALDPQTGTYLKKDMYAYVMIAETAGGVQYKKTGRITIK